MIHDCLNQTREPLGSLRMLSKNHAQKAKDKELSQKSFK